jgi:hypothetical protein
MLCMLCVTTIDRATAVGERAQQRHHAALVAGIEPRRRLVEEQQRGLGDELHRDRDASALAAGETADEQLAPGGDAEPIEHLLDLATALGAGTSRGKAQLRAVVERLRDGQPAVQDVLLGHVAEAQAQLVVVAVEVAPVVEHVSLGGRAKAGQRVEQRRLARTGRPDDGEERALLEAERDVAEQRASVRRR